MLSRHWMFWALTIFDRSNSYRANVVLFLKFPPGMMTFDEMIMTMVIILFVGYLLIEEQNLPWTKASFMRRCFYQAQLRHVGLSCLGQLCITPSSSKVCWNMWILFSVEPCAIYQGMYTLVQSTCTCNMPAQCNRIPCYICCLWHGSQFNCVAFWCIWQGM